MKKISSALYDRSTLLLAILGTVVSFGFLFLVVIDKGTCYELPGKEGTSLGLNMWYTLEMVQQFFSERTDEMLQCYKVFGMIYDNLFAITYGVMNAVWISLLFAKHKARIGLFNLFPFLQSFLDFGENYMLGSMATAHIDGEIISKSTVAISASMTATKWVIYGLVTLLILLGVVVRIVDFFKRRNA